MAIKYTNEQHMLLMTGVVAITLEYILILVAAMFSWITPLPWRDDLGIIGIVFVYYAYQLRRNRARIMGGWFK